MTDDERQARLVYSPGAYAVVRGDQPQVFLAENATVISRLLALKLVARANPRSFESEQLAAARSALLEERWADAVVVWMEATGQFVDVYEEYVHVWTEADLDADFASMEIRVAPIFDHD